jgi:hypothetical protein
MGTKERQGNKARQAALNHRIKAARNDEKPEESDLTCECSDFRCCATLQLTDSERTFRSTRRAHFWVKPGHALIAVERVIEENDRYAIVEDDARASLGTGIVTSWR